MTSGSGVFIVNFEHKQLTIVTKNSNLDIGAIAYMAYMFKVNSKDTTATFIDITDIVLVSLLLLLSI